MRKAKIQTKLLMLSISLLIGIALHSTATAQATDSVVTSPTTPVVRQDDLQTCLQRLDKTLDAFEKSQKALGFAMDEIEARKRLDALKDQIIAVKDIIIANQDELIKRLQGNKSGFMERLKRILGIAEKIALIGLGIYIAK